MARVEMGVEVMRLAEEVNAQRMSFKFAAEQPGVSERQLRRAIRLYQMGSPALLQPAKIGPLSVGGASEVVKLSQDHRVQDAIVILLDKNLARNANQAIDQYLSRVAIEAEHQGSGRRGVEKALPIVLQQIQDLEPVAAPPIRQYRAARRPSHQAQPEERFSVVQPPPDQGPFPFELLLLRVWKWVRRK